MDCHFLLQEILRTQGLNLGLPHCRQTLLPSETTTQLHSSHTLAKQCSKFSKSGLNSKLTVNFQMFKLDFEKAEEPEIKLLASTGSSKKQAFSRKTTYSALSNASKPLTVWITTNCGKSSRDGNIRPPDLPPEKSVCRSRSKS